MYFSSARHHMFPLCHAGKGVVFEGTSQIFSAAYVHPSTVGFAIPCFGGNGVRNAFG
jgi:hypothetical protein